MYLERLFFTSCLLGSAFGSAACGDDSGSPLERGTDDAAASSGPDAGQRTPGAGTTSEKCVFPPHTKGSGSPQSACQFACEKGFADCDGQIANGCEVALTGADACAQCPAMAAMRCLQPDLCGLDQPVCTPLDGTVWTSQGDIVDSEISSLVVGADNEQAFAVTSRKFDGSKMTASSPGATLFGMKLAEGGGLSWVAAGTGSMGRIHRFGDRLYLHSGNPADLEEMSVGAFSLDGKLLWSKSIGDSENARFGGGLAVDAAGNVYVTGDRNRDGGRLVVALDASGNERWRKSLANASSKQCRGLIVGALHDLRVVGNRLVAINDGCLLQLDPSSGAITSEQVLHVWADDAWLRSDGAGNLYVAAQAEPGPVMPIPNLLGPDWNESKGFPTNANSIYVSKYGPDLKHLWTHSFASTGNFATDQLSHPSLRGFDVNAAGVGYLLGFGGEFPFLVQFDTNGKSVAAAFLENRLYPAHKLAVAENGTPFLAGTFKTTIKDLGTGMFIWNLAFDKGGPVARNRDAGTSQASDGGARAADAGAARAADGGRDSAADVGLDAAVQSDAATAPRADAGSNVAASDGGASSDGGRP